MLRPTYPLRTDRLLLRPYTDDDLAALHEIERRQETARFLYNEPLSLDAARAVLERRKGMVAVDDDHDDLVLMPGVVFEEVTVKAIDETLDGPFGMVEGIVVQELHMDGGTEEKSFASGYGEFYTSDGTDTEALALAVPTDAADEPVPAQLTSLVETAHAGEEMAEARNWASASASAATMAQEWDAYAGDAPVLFGPVMTDAIAALTESIDAEDSPAAIQAAIDVARLSLDLQLRYRPPSEVDLARLGVWSRQLVLDARQEEADAVNGDLFAIDYVRDRDLGIELADMTRLNYLLEELQALVTEEDLDGVAEAAGGLEDFVTEVAGS